MSKLSVLIIFVAIYSITSFVSGFQDDKEEIIFLDTTELINNNPSQDSIPLIPIIPQISADTNNLIKEEPKIVITDTSNLIKEEPRINITDTSNILNNVPLISPSDSSTLIQEEKKISMDSLNKTQPGINDSLNILQPLVNDSLNIIKAIPKDTIPRIQFRSVYVDSIEQNNPNFLPKSVLEIKWISEKRDTLIRYKNVIGFNLFYGTYTYGFGAGIFKRLGNDADFIANVNLSYIFDRRTASDLDSNGNMADLEHRSRIYSIIFNVGLEKYFLQNRNSWMMKPILIFGFTPAFVFTTPYSLKMFSSLKKMQLSYGIGVFTALGFDYQAFKTFGINLTARYSFIPIIIGNDVYYYNGFKVKNIGGFYVNLGITLLQPYYSKN